MPEIVINEWVTISRRAGAYRVFVDENFNRSNIAPKIVGVSE